MVRLLFDNFLNNPIDYAECTTYWKKLVDDILEAVGQAGEWPRWIPLTYADGKTPIDERGNPIFDGRSSQLDRAFRIIQHPPTSEDEPEISAWLTHFDDEYDELPRDELVINLSLSDESADIVRKLLGKWVEPATSIEEMQELIETQES